MASGRSLRGYSAEHTAAGRGARRPRTILGLTAVAVLALLGVAARASALTITGGPGYTLPGGGSCSPSGTAASARAGRGGARTRGEHDGPHPRAFGHPGGPERERQNHNGGAP